MKRPRLRLLSTFCSLRFWGMKCCSWMIWWCKWFKFHFRRSRSRMFCKCRMFPLQVVSQVCSVPTILKFWVTQPTGNFLFIKFTISLHKAKMSPHWRFRSFVWDDCEIESSFGRHHGGSAEAINTICVSCMNTVYYLWKPHFGIKFC